MEEFEQWLQDIGKSPSTARMYASSVKTCMENKTMTSSLNGRKLSASTKNAHRAALKQWAEFTQDSSLKEQLDDPKLKRAIQRPGSKMPTQVKPFSVDQMAMFRKILLALKNNAGVDAWIWPTLSIFRKLALRAGVDLCRIRRDAAAEALKTNVLQLWTKGARIREVPSSSIKEELEWLLQFKRWEILADLISPGAAPSSRVDAAYKQVSIRLKNIGQAAGIDPTEIHSHRFRHTRAMELYEKSKDLLAVQNFLGHKNVETTIRYLHIDTQKIAAYLNDLP